MPADSTDAASGEMPGERGGARGGQGGRLVLEVATGVDPGATIVVEDHLMLGRHATPAGTLGGDEELSRRHAEIRRQPLGRYSLVDLGSTNGTFVNGQKIEGSVELSIGDAIEVGATRLVVREVGGREPGPPAPHQTGRQDTVVSGRLAGTGSSPWPPLSLSAEFDFVAGELRVRIRDQTEVIRLTAAGDSWHVWVDREENEPSPE